MPTYIGTVGPDRTIELPRELCERLDIEDGTRVEFFLTSDGQVHFHALTQSASGFGFDVDMPRPPLSIREMDDAIGEHACDEEDRLRRQWKTARANPASRPAAE